MVKRQWADRQRPSPLRPLRVQIPPFVAARHLPPARGKSFLKGRAPGETGRHCGLHGNFPAMPKPPSMREVASPSGLDGRSSYPNYSFSRTTCDSSPKGRAPGKTGGHCGLHGNFPAMPKPPSMREVASPTGLDGRSSYPNYSFSRTTCDSSPKWEQAHP